MAENAAHLATTLHSRPTIFEFIAQESLLDTLRPSVKLICDFLARNNSLGQGNFMKWFDEIFLSLNYVLQYHYLKAFQGTFSEAFYGLQRVPKNSKLKKLSTLHKSMSLLTVVILPYLKIKAQKLTKKYQSELFGKEVETLQDKLMFGFVYGFKLFNFAWETAKLVQMVLYLAGLKSTPTPLLDISGVYLNHQKENSNKRLSLLDLFRMCKKKKSCSGSVIYLLLFRLLTEGLEKCAFFVQFLQWWHSENSLSRLNTTSAPKPPLLGGPKPANTCPICKEPRKIEVALQTSGFMFCYKCIKAWLEDNSTCPVTKIPSTTDDLVRVYPAK